MRIIGMIGAIFTVAGLVMLTVAGFLLNSSVSLQRDAITTQGVVVDIERTRSDDSVRFQPVIEFTDDQGRDTEFAAGGQSNRSSYGVGDNVDVLFLPGRPDTARVDSFSALWAAPTIVGGLGLVFTLVGGAVIGTLLHRRWVTARVRQRGQQILAEVQSVERNTRLSVNGRHPYQIVAQWQDPTTRTVHVFKSDNLWFDPSEFMSGSTVSVHIDPTKPRRHWMDTSFLPDRAT